MSDTIRVLRVARNFIANGWCRKGEARDKHRHPVSLTSPKVDSVSLQGAVSLALASIRLKNRPRTEKRVLKILASKVVGKDALRYMDEEDAYEALKAYNELVAKTRQDVLNVFDEAFGGL